MTIEKRHWLLFERTVPLLVLAVLLWFTIGRFWLGPYAGFRYDLRDGRVVEIYVSDDGPLRIGDILQQVGEVEWEGFQKDLSQRLFSSARPGDRIPLQVERDDAPLSITWTFPGINQTEFLQRFNSEWWLPYVFWLGGLATLLFVRPRNEQWLLLSAFNFLTAIWMGGGGVGYWRVPGSILATRAAAWLSVPVYLHLHWQFPRPLAKLPRWIWLSLYAVALILIGLEVGRFLPNNLYQSGLVLALFTSMMLVVLRLILRQTQWREMRVLAGALAVALLPMLVTILGEAVGIQLPYYLEGGVLLALPAIPGAYFYTIYQRQLGRRQRRARRFARVYLGTLLVAALLLLVLAILSGLRTAQASIIFINGSVLVVGGLMAIIAVAPFLALLALGNAAAGRELHVRANRIAAPYLFFAVMVPLISIVMLLLNEWFRWPSLVLIVAVTVTMGITLPLYRPFHRLLERFLLGLELPPEQLLQEYASRITTSLDRNSLVHLLREEVLPTLLVRQSALLRLDENEEPEVLYVQQVTEERIPAPASLAEMENLPPWIRLVLPLRISDQTIGYWLLGRRDPDDWYRETERPIFQTLANQTAVALHHIIQAETLHTLYQMNIQRREEERNRLARELHDGVLGELGAIMLFLNEETLPPQFHRAYAKLIARLRQAIGGLRPAMLNYGLRAGLEELVDDLDERAKDSVDIRLDVPESHARYSVEVEQHLFRMVQQAAENALRHADAQTIRIRGRLAAEEVELAIVDDGLGIDAATLDLATLLAHDHFGLASMKERAALIGAALQIVSAPGRGTTVKVHWQPEQATEAQDNGAR